MRYAIELCLFAVALLALAGQARGAEQARSPMKSIRVNVSFTSVEGYAKGDKVPDGTKKLQASFSVEMKGELCYEREDPNGFEAILGITEVKHTPENPGPHFGAMASIRPYRMRVTVDRSKGYQVVFAVLDEKDKKLAGNFSEMAYIICDMMMLMDERQPSSLRISADKTIMAMRLSPFKPVKFAEETSATGRAGNPHELTYSAAPMLDGGKLKGILLQKAHGSAGSLTLSSRLLTENGLVTHATDLTAKRFTSRVRELEALDDESVPLATRLSKAGMAEFFRSDDPAWFNRYSLIELSAEYVPATGVKGSGRKKK